MVTWPADLQGIWMCSVCGVLREAVQLRNLSLENLASGWPRMHRERAHPRIVFTARVQKDLSRTTLLRMR